VTRWFRSACWAVLLMMGDVIVFVAFGITMGPKGPRWITMPMFWVLAWPVSLFRQVIPNHTPGAHGPSLLAWFAGGVVDIIWVTLLVDWIRHRRAQPKSIAAPDP